MRGTSFTTLLVWALMSATGKSQPLCSQQAIMSPGTKVRPEVKAEIDRIRGYSLAGPAHTTDAMAPNAPPASTAAKPEDPRPFPAGNYRSLFSGNGRSVALWVNSERHLGHYVTVDPGLTRVQGTVQLSPDADANPPVGPVLNNDEMDYLIASIYAKFCSPLDADQANRLNSLKDMVLAVRFGEKIGLQKCHHRLLARLAGGQE